MSKSSVFFTKKELRTFCIYRFIFGIGYSIMIPIIPLYLNSIGITTVMIGTVLSLYGVSKAVVQMPFGAISDAIGDKLVLMIAILLMVFIPFAYTLNNSSIIASCIYIIQGAVLGMAVPATFSILSRSLDPKKRGESTGLASSVFTLGGGIGAAIGGFIVSKINNYNLSFYISSIIILISLLYVKFKIKSTNHKASIKKDGTNKSNRIFYQIRKYNLGYKIIVLGTIAFLGDFIYGCVVALFHFYGRDVLGATTSYTSSIISIYLIVFGLGAPIAGWVSDKIGNKRQLFLSFSVMNISLLGLSLIRNLPIFTAIIIVYFLGATFLNASLQSSLSEFGDNPKIKGIVFGFIGASESCGYAFGPIMSAYIYEMNKSFLFFWLLFVSIIVSLLYLFLHKKAAI
ncbi:MFS transporter [Paraclostridium sordellii]|uniref:MFS transporter n=1 Tax=Paraclostridium sordellii TaxID=1505 RepID=UPI0005EA5B50|nr:MFS transporter [Paeniclostridium sordellii]CEP81932.1 transporter major facilitator family [[Clostridium] sordellii] [Paeniclostridium sordellii]